MALYFPPAADEGWETVDPEALGWNAAALAETLAFAEAHDTDQLVILDGGRLVVNAAFGCTPADSGDVFAVQKGLFAVLLGVACDKNLVKVDDPLSKYLPPGWTRLPAADEARLTIRHLITMTTGMTDALEAEGEIGLTWRYNNAAYNYLKRILIEQTGQDLQSLSSDWLLARVGMAHTRWVDRDAVLPDGRRISGLEMSALDMARLGLLMLADGRWHGEPLLADPAYRRAMLAPGSDANPAWCYLWWRNDQSRFMVPFRDDVYDGAPIANAPRDMIMAQGALDNRLYVVPSSGRVIARRGRAAFPRGQHRLFWDHLTRIWETP